MPLSRRSAIALMGGAAVAPLALAAAPAFAQGRVRPEGGSAAPAAGTGGEAMPTATWLAKLDSSRRLPGQSCSSSRRRAA